MIAPCRIFLFFPQGFILVSEVDSLPSHFLFFFFSFFLLFFPGVSSIFHLFFILFFFFFLLFLFSSCVSSIFHLFFFFFFFFLPLPTSTIFFLFSFLCVRPPSSFLYICIFFLPAACGVSCTSFSLVCLFVFFFFFSQVLLHAAVIQRCRCGRIPICERQWCGPVPCDWISSGVGSPA
jgi:hypothetical protein